MWTGPCVLTWCSGDDHSGTETQISVTAVRALTGQNLDWGTIYPKLMVYPYNICMSNKGPQGAPM